MMTTLGQGACYRDKFQLCIILDTNSSMFKKPEPGKENAYDTALTLLVPLLGRIETDRVFKENLLLLYGKKMIPVRRSYLVRDSYQECTRMKMNKDSIYRTIIRRLRSGRLNAGRYIVLTDHELRVPIAIKSKTIVLDFNTSSTEATGAITNTTRYAHINLGNARNVADEIFKHVVIPHQLTRISGWWPSIGSLLGRTSPGHGTGEYFGSNIQPLMVQNIELVGIGKKCNFNVNRLLGQAVYQEYNPNDDTEKYKSLKDLEMITDYLDGGYNSMEGDFNRFVRIFKVANIKMRNAGMFLLGKCKDCITKREMLVVFSPVPSFALRTNMDFPDWIYSQNLFNEWDSCDSHHHKMVTLTDAQQVTDEDDMQNWNADVPFLRLEFYEWPEVTSMQPVELINTMI